MIITSKKAKEKHKELKSYWSEESRLSQKILIACLENLERLNGKKRKASKWNKFVAEKLKKGKTIKEASVDWNKMKK